MPTIRTLTEAAAKAATRKGKAGERVRWAFLQLVGLKAEQALSVTPDEGESPDAWRTAFLDAARAHGRQVRTRVVDNTLYVRWEKGEAPKTPSPEQKGSADEATILGVLPTTTDMGDVILARTKAQLDAAIAEAREEQWPADRFVYACEKRPGKPHPHGPGGECLGVTP